MLNAASETATYSENKSKIRDESTFILHVDTTLTFKDYQLFKAQYLSLHILPQRIVVDFTRTEKIDCSGLAMLLILQDFCNDHSIVLQLYNVAKGNVPKMLEIAKFNQKFSIEERGLSPSLAV